MSIPVAILVRVSTARQDTDRQIQELRKVAHANGWTVVKVVEEIVSGSKATRAGLDTLAGMAFLGEIKKVLVHEVSRVARKNSMAHSFVEQLTEAGVSLYWHAQKIETLLPDGRRNPAAMVMFALLAEFAQAEREQLVERTRSGLQAARNRGVRLGRTAGVTEDPEVFLAKYPEVVRLVRMGKSVRDIAARAEVAPNTVQKVKAHLALQRS